MAACNLLRRYLLKEAVELQHHLVIGAAFQSLHLTLGSFKVCFICKHGGRAGNSAQSASPAQEQSRPMSQHMARAVQFLNICLGKKLIHLNTYFISAEAQVFQPLIQSHLLSTL